MKPMVRQILSAVAAIGCLVFLSRYTQFVFWFNLAVSAGIGLATYLTLPAKPRPDQIEVAPGISQAELDNAVNAVQTYQKEFFSLAANCANPDMSHRIGEISDALGKIAQSFTKDPDQLVDAGLFLNTYLPNALDLVTKCVRISGPFSSGNPGNKQVPVASIVEQVHSGIVQFHLKNMQNDILDIEAQAELLRSLSE